VRKSSHQRWVRRGNPLQKIDLIACARAYPQKKEKKKEDGRNRTHKKRKDMNFDFSDDTIR
jgi:hypothetical protein